jgi:L-lactate dehydrogenase
MTEGSHHAQPRRVAIVGAGNVGATFAYALSQSGLASEIVLIDQNRTRAEGEAMDLNHAAPFFSPTRIWAGDYADCAGAFVTVITAGANQKPGETRLDLVKKNAGIFRQIVPQIVQHNPNGIILVTTNPVDVLTYAAWKISGLPAPHIIGSGTILDTARFRYLLSEYYGVDPRSVHAYIIGEHGDSEVPVWSKANIAGMQLKDFCCVQDVHYDQARLEAIFKQTRDAAYQIIERKGATYYAIGAGLVRVVEAILRDQRTVLPVSVLVDKYYGIDDVYLSLPAVIDRGGIESILRLELEESEIIGLRQSADVLHSTLAQLEL